VSVWTSLAFVAAVALVAAAPLASSTDFCNGNGNVITVGPHPAQVVHVAIDPTYYGWFSIWIYAETNGERDLQRGGVTLLGDADICQDSTNPDQGIF